MLDTAIYEQALRLYVENIAAAKRHGDTREITKQWEKVVSVLNYCGTFGFYLTTRDDQIALQRNGYTPGNVHILVDGRTAYPDYVSPLERHYWEGNRYGMTFIDYCAAFASLEDIKRYHADKLEAILSSDYTTNTYWYCGAHPHRSLLLIGNSYYCRDCNDVAAKIIDASPEAYSEFLDSVAGDAEYAAHLEHVHSPGADEY